MIDTIHTWTTITKQLTRTLRGPDLDFAGAVDRVFDVAEQTLAVQRQLALTVAGVATRQVDTALETVDTAVAAVETTVGEGVRRVEDLVKPPRLSRSSRTEEPQARRRSRPSRTASSTGVPMRSAALEELRERAGELQLEGRSPMNKDDLITARDHRKQRSAKNDASKQGPTLDRRT